MALAIIVLYIIQFSGINNPAVEEDEPIEEDKGLSVAFVKVDSLIFNYLLAKNLNDDFKKKQESFHNTYTSKRLRFEKDAKSFKEKIQRGAFLTQERALEERDRILAKENEINELDYKLSNELAEMQANINQQIVDSLANYLKLYNADKKYDFILNSSGLLESVEQHNITKEITDGLNQRYELYAKK